MDTMTEDEEVRCLFCNAGPETAALIAVGPILACIDDGPCLTRWATRHRPVEVKALANKLRGAA